MIAFGLHGLLTQSSLMNFEWRYQHYGCQMQARSVKMVIFYQHLTLYIEMVTTEG